MSIASVKVCSTVTFTVAAVAANGVPPVPTNLTATVPPAAPAVAPLAIITGATVNSVLNPSAANVTGPENPALRTIVTTTVAFPPGVT